MCEFCHQHGEGKKWYLDARNFSEDLLSDLRRRRFIERFFSDPEHLARGDRALRIVDLFPRFLTKRIRERVTARQKINHFGQVVPIEDLEKIFGFVTSVTRLACICRHVASGREQRYCYGVSLAPDGGEMASILQEIDASYLIGPQTQGLEHMSKDQALEHIRASEKEGMCHTVWTFKTPFIGGICNCNLPECLAMKTTLTHRTPVMFRAEYEARVDEAKCTGCGRCADVCPFGAIPAVPKKGKARIDPRKCYGCGVCRSVCEFDAISLVDRTWPAELVTSPAVTPL